MGVPRPYQSLKQHHSTAASFQEEISPPMSSTDPVPLQEEEVAAAVGEEDQEGLGDGGKQGREG